MKSFNINSLLGPFTDKIFSIVSYQKNKMDILLGNIRTTLKRKENIIIPL